MIIPKERLEWIQTQAGANSTGWQVADKKLYGGLNRGELTFLAGGLEQVKVCPTKLGT